MLVVFACSFDVSLCGAVGSSLLVRRSSSRSPRGGTRFMQSREGRTTTRAPQRRPVCPGYSRDPNRRGRLTYLPRRFGSLPRDIFDGPAALIDLDARLCAVLSCLPPPHLLVLFS